MLEGRYREMPRSVATRTLVESALLVAIATMFSVLDAYVPLFALVYPLPIVVLVVRRGVRAGVWATLVTIAATTMVVGPLQGVTVLTMVGIIGITMAWCIRSRFTPLRTLLLTSVAVAVSVALTFGLGAAIGGFKLAELEEALQQGMGSAISLYRSLGVPEAELTRAQTYVSQVVETAKVTLPALLLATVVSMAGLNYLLARLVLGKLGHKLDRIPRFAGWRVTWPFGWGYIAGLVLSIAGQARGVPLAWKAGLNMLSLFGLVFLIQGVALCWYFMDRYRMNLAIRLILIVFALFNPIVYQVLSWVGLLDAWLDFRKLSSESGGRST